MHSLLNELALMAILLLVVTLSSRFWGAAQLDTPVDQGQRW
jgi:hypothetical protein